MSCTCLTIRYSAVLFLNMLKLGGGIIMNTLILGIRVLFFALSVFGWLTFLHKRTDVNVEFLPASVFCGQICVLFLAGILNLLPLAAALLFLGGLVLAALSLKNRRMYRVFFCAGYIFFAAAGLYFLLLLKGQVFNTYDNFSHWALVVKQMLMTDRFPTFQDPIILFQAYPVGSSAFVYYVSKIISTVSEGCQMFAQTLLSLSMILPLFSFVRKKRAEGILLILGASLFFLGSNTGPTELLVDTLLPLTGGFGFLLLERELEGERQTVWLSVLPAIAVITIKNSGIFFWALMAVKLGIHWFRNRKKAGRDAVTSWAALIFAPLSFFLLWNRHVAYVFSSASSTPHSMSLSAYLTNIQVKLTDGSVTQIVHAFLQKVWERHELFYLLAVILLIAIASRAKKLPGKSFAKPVLFILTAYVLYQIGNLCMYLFSMPEGEALVMAGYDRYYESILLFCCLYALSWILKWMDLQKHFPAAAVTLLLLCVFWNSGTNPAILRRTPVGSVRAEMERLMTDYSIEHYLDYLVCIPQDDMGFTYHLTKYLLYTNTVDVHVITDKAQFAETVQIAIDLGYRYLINLDPGNPAITEYCMERFGTSDPVIRLQ